MSGSEQARAWIGADRHGREHENQLENDEHRNKIKILMGGLIKIIYFKEMQ